MKYPHQRVKTGFSNGVYPHFSTIFTEAFYTFRKRVHRTRENT
jgi:hypothetical protein